MTDIAKLRADALAATPGPWHTSGFLVIGSRPAYEPIADTELDSPHMAENAVHIANCDPATLIKLLDVVEALKEAKAVMLQHGFGMKNVDEALSALETK